jgi:hypothetical protein
MVHMGVSGERIMPGRRYPRRIQQETQSSHVRSVFRGGMDGASHIPYPVGYRQDQNSSKSNCLETLFFNDEFAAAGGSQSVTLTWLPIPYSEHVYLWREGQGIYQSEGIAWARDGGSRTVRVQGAMNARAGDYIVVEYAYYAQAMEVSRCGPSYPRLVVPSSPTLTEVFPGTSDDVWLPAPENFPRKTDSASRNDYWKWNAWHADYLAGNAQPAGAIAVSVGPPLAPGSTGSRQITPGDTWHGIYVMSGETNPRWREATYIGVSTYCMTSGLTQPPLGTLYSSTWVIVFLSSWYDSEEHYGIEYDLAYRALDRTWYVIVRSDRPEKDSWGDWYPEANITINDPVWNSKSPYDSGTHFTSLYVDLVAKTVTFKWDDAVFSYTGPEVWPDPADFEDDQMNYVDTDVSVMNMDGGGVKGVTYSITDQLTFDSDVPYCSWGKYSPLGW